MNQYSDEQLIGRRGRGAYVLFSDNGAGWVCVGGRGGGGAIALGYFLGVIRF